MDQRQIDSIESQCVACVQVFDSEFLLEKQFVHYVWTRQITVTMLSQKF